MRYKSQVPDGAQHSGSGRERRGKGAGGAFTGGGSGACGLCPDEEMADIS